MRKTMCEKTEFEKESDREECYLKIRYAEK